MTRTRRVGSVSAPICSTWTCTARPPTINARAYFPSQRSISLRARRRSAQTVRSSRYGGSGWRSKVSIVQVARLQVMCSSVGWRGVARVSEDPHSRTRDTPAERICRAGHHGSGKGGRRHSVLPRKSPQPALRVRRVGSLASAERRRVFLAADPGWSAKAHQRLAACGSPEPIVPRLRRLHGNRAIPRRRQRSFEPWRRLRRHVQ